MCSDDNDSHALYFVSGVQGGFSRSVWQGSVIELF
jgi:hypothetical protein